MKIDQIKNNFPIFKKKINNKPLVYLDSANSSQKPKSVIDRMSFFYENEDYHNINYISSSILNTPFDKSLPRGRG